MSKTQSELHDFEADQEPDDTDREAEPIEGEQADQSEPFDGEERGRIKHHAEAGNLPEMLRCMGIPDMTGRELIEAEGWETAADVLEHRGEWEDLDGIGPSRADDLEAAAPLIADAIETADDSGEDDPEAVADGGEQVEEEPDHGDHFDGEAETVTAAWEGAYIYTSWGYGQTNVEMAQIVDVSDSGKTVLARLVAPERVDAAKGSESLRPTAEQYGDEFRLHVRGSGDKPAFRGSYPFINGEMDEGTRLGSFLPWSNKAGQTVHQTAPGYGH